jgi:hypothetical protein
MAGLADAFLALPGGYGTLEELFEVITWRQLGLHRKPIGLMDCDGYWNGMRQFLDHMKAEGFALRAEAGGLPCETDPERMLDRLAELRG